MPKEQEQRRRSLMESGEASSSGEPLSTRPDDGSWTPFAAADGEMESQDEEEEEGIDTVAVTRQEVMYFRNTGTATWSCQCR